MRELTRVGPVMKGEARVIRRTELMEYSEALPIAVSSWRERGGTRWVCVKTFAGTFGDGDDRPELEIFIPIETFTQTRGQELPGPAKAHVSR